MVYDILAILFLIAFGALAGILGWQIKINRRKNLDYQGLDDYRVAGLLVDYLAFRIVRFCWSGLNTLYLFSIHFIKNSISTARYVIVKIERRFNRLASNLTKPEVIHSTDKVSFFLKEIKDHKETMMAEMKNDLNQPE